MVFQANLNGRRRISRSVSQECPNSKLHFITWACSTFEPPIRKIIELILNQIIKECLFEIVCAEWNRLIPPDQ
jgi:hypothetical protein